jgi:hypothetical protein
MPFLHLGKKRSRWVCMIGLVKVDLHPQLSEKGFPVNGWIDGWMGGYKMAAN